MVGKLNSTKNLVNRIRGWLPKEPQMPTVQVGNATRKVFSKRSLLLISAGIIVAMLIAGSIFFFLTFNAAGPISFSDPTDQAQDTVNAYINALNDYNAAAAWSLMSPSIQASYGTLENFNDSFVSQLQASGWHAQIIKNVADYGTVAFYSFVPIQDSLTVVEELGIARNNLSLTAGTFTFNVKTYAYSHNQPTDWKVDNKFTG